MRNRARKSGAPPASTGAPQRIQRFRRKSKQPTDAAFASSQQQYNDQPKIDKISDKRSETEASWLALVTWLVSAAPDGRREPLHAASDTT
jgi:hypothetical protein